MSSARAIVHFQSARAGCCWPCTAPAAGRAPPPLVAAVDMAVVSDVDDRVQSCVRKRKPGLALVGKFSSSSEPTPPRHTKLSARARVNGLPTRTLLKPHQIYPISASLMHPPCPCFPSISPDALVPDSILTRPSPYLSLTAQAPNHRNADLARERANRDDEVESHLIALHTTTPC